MIDPPAGAVRWPAHLQGALDGTLDILAGDYSQATIEAALAENKMQLWAAHESFCLTELRVSPTGQRSVNLFLCGGTLLELRPLLPIIEGWAISQGAVKMTALGRHGWAKTFLTKDEGFRPTMTCYEKPLGGSNE